MTHAVWFLVLLAVLTLFGRCHTIRPLTQPHKYTTTPINIHKNIYPACPYVQDEGGYLTSTEGPETEAVLYCGCDGSVFFRSTGHGKVARAGQKQTWVLGLRPPHEGCCAPRRWRATGSDF